MSTLTMNADDRGLDLREVVKNKADKHRRYYRKLCATYADDSVLESEMEQPTSPVEKYTTNVRFSSDDGILEDDESKGRSGNQLRQRRTGVFEMVHGTEDEESVFKSVKLMREKYQAMLERTSKNLQESQTEKKLNRSGSVDGLLAPPVSGYCSSTASTGSDDEREKNWPPKHAPVVRCSSSDSALGLTQSDDELTNVGARWTNSADISTSNFSPYSPRGSVDHVNVPTKTLIEAQCVQLPLDRKLSDCVSDSDLDKCDSRRQSCFTDDGEEQTRYRFWRTPSIVVSDYSDDVIGLTLDDIEFYRNQRKETSSSPDSSVHSSCSNLNYCGSTISSLDAEYIRRQPFRKSSDCSTCSTLSGDEDTEGSLQPPSSDKGKNVTDPTSGKQIPDATEGPKVHDHPPGDAPVAAKPDAKPPSKPAPKPAPKPSPKPDPKPEAPKPPAPAA